MAIDYLRKWWAWWNSSTHDSQNDLWQMTSKKQYLHFCMPEPQQQIDRKFEKWFQDSECNKQTNRDAGKTIQSIVNHQADIYDNIELVYPGIDFEDYCKPFLARNHYHMYTNCILTMYPDQWLTSFIIFYLM